MLTVRSYFATYFVSGSSTFRDEHARHRHDFVMDLKTGRSLKPAVLDWIATNMSHLFSTAVLVPVPTSRVAPPETWPSAILCAKILERCEGCAVDFLVNRHTAVEKSAKRGAIRTTVAQHIQSMHARALSDYKVVLVDDVSTKGTQLVAAAHAIRQAGHVGQILGFAAAYVPHVSVGDPEHDLAMRDYHWDGRAAYPTKSAIVAAS